MPSSVLVIPEGFGEGAVHFSLSGVPHPIVSTIGFHSTDGDLAADGQNALEALEGSIWDAIWGGSSANLAVGYTYLGMEARFNSSDGGVVSLAAPRAVAGTASVAVMAANSSWLIQKRTHLGGRKHRGRLYWPAAGMPENTVSAAGAIDTASVTGQQTLWNNLMTELDGIGSPVAPYILHRQEAGGPTPPAPTPINSFVVSPIIATQRRRLHR